ncbi:unnamed protein product [Chrysodeixis includens]|uniref:Epg5-like TPR domain-containing protein n=1 Tax=Chrysodeixis includens TaxID=689277 RepID=A0A9P0BR35_CHRIL|nr:unnamed protein product [Chrysodeixis includens]
MATMVKEKRKGKKKEKEKSSSPKEDSPELGEPPPAVTLADFAECGPSGIQATKTVTTDSNTNEPGTSKTSEHAIAELGIKEDREDVVEEESAKDQIAGTNVVSKERDTTVPEAEAKSEHDEATETATSTEANESTESTLPNFQSQYNELSMKLDRMAIPTEVTEHITEEREQELEHYNAYLTVQDTEVGTQVGEDSAESAQEVEENTMVFVQDAVPSAPCFEEIPQGERTVRQEVERERRPRVKPMAIEDAIRLCGGKEMDEVRQMSEAEEAMVAIGSLIGPGSTLFDLLPTLRTSLIATEKERMKLAYGFVEEEKSRNSLWKVEKRQVNLSEKCPCGLSVDLKLSYEHAELNKARLPIAKMTLDKLLRDTQESFCHYQFLAMMAHAQIEALLADTIQSNKNFIRDSLALVLSELRQSDNAPDVLASALERWAAALSAALVDNRDLRQLIYLLHHLFRHPRSVQWAWDAVTVEVDSASPWRVLALLELLLTNSRADAALECTEELEEAWEEVDKHGGGGAVSDGTLRERDLLALLHAFPLRDLLARLLLFTHRDIKLARAHEWGDNSGGRRVLRAACGVRALLHVLRAACRKHPTYMRLVLVLRDLAVHALLGLACLHLNCKSTYDYDLADKIQAECEAAFAAGFSLLSKQELHRLPATLLSDITAKEYCIANIVSIHDSTATQLDQLSLELPVLPCDVRVRVVTQAAVDRKDDHEVARIVIEFLLQTGIKRKSVSCKGLCDIAARECLGEVLAAHPYLHTIALQIVADLNIVESLSPSCVKTLLVHKWRPTGGELSAVLEDWARRCPHFLQHLLLQLDCTPYVGLTLDVQLTLGTWLCSYVDSQPNCLAPDWCWSALRRLRLHRTSWLLAHDAPPPEHPPTHLFSVAHALLATSWGHCIPVICVEGITGLCQLASSRPRDAIHCLSGVMLVMAQSPESVAFTPMFTDLFTSLLNAGPSLVARALGRGGAAGPDLLLRLILAQLADPSCSAGLVCAWLQAAWRPQLGGSARALLDAAAAATRLWPHLDAYAASLIQEENAQEHITTAVRNAACAPLLCECVLRAWHAAREVGAGLLPRLLAALHQQRLAGQKAHVDNALQSIGAKISSEELVIYRAANAALVAPMQHPSHLTLWRLLIHLYLQRPPGDMLSSPLGPQFFSGLIKSRTLGQMKKRLKETITYHLTECDSLKLEHKSLDIPEPQTNSIIERASVTVEDDLLFPGLKLEDLVGEGESDDSEDCAEESGGSKESSPNREVSDQKRDVASMISYHTSAAKLLTEYLGWLEGGEQVRAEPHHADIARFIPEHALDVAWKRCVPRPAASPELDSFPLPAPRPPPDNTPPVTPFHTAINTLLAVKDRSGKRRKRIALRTPMPRIDYSDSRALMSALDKHLKTVETLAQEWYSELSRVEVLDTKLWELVGGLRVNRQLPAVRKSCANKCKSIIFVIPEQESCRSEDAERRVKENRRSARVALQRLARVRPRAVSTAAAVYHIIRNLSSSEAALRVIERVWSSAGAPHCETCPPTKQLIVSLVMELAERWVRSDGRMCVELLSSWSKRARCGLQQELCGSVLAPRHLASEHWTKLYTVVLESPLPSHTVFSYLSKFEVTRWSKTIDKYQHKALLEALVLAAQRWGMDPPQEHSMLLEIIGIHTGILVHTQEYCSHVIRCSHASVNRTLPPSHWGHVNRAVANNPEPISIDDFNALLRMLGKLWWDARQNNRDGKTTPYAAYAPHIAILLNSLQRAFVAAAINNSYEPSRIAWDAWATLLYSWNPWILPYPTPPILLSAIADQDSYTPMLRHFVDIVHQIMIDCPGTEIHLLQATFEWCVETYEVCLSKPNLQESRVQAAALLAETAKLPWDEHQWFYGKCLMIALRISNSNDKDLTSWCCACWRGTTAETLQLQSQYEPAPLPRLALLIQLLTSTLPHHPQIYEEGCKLPWSLLPQEALDEALDRYFMVHHNPAVAYHDMPHFRIILLACDLITVEEEAPVRACVAARVRRARGVSQWVRGASSPALVAHVPAHARKVLDVITDIGAYCIKEAEDELEELLSRAIVILCIEPAASVALTVWISYLLRSKPPMVTANVSAAAAITDFQYFGPVADDAARTLMRYNDGLPWYEFPARWQSIPFPHARALAAAGRAHAAYTVALAYAQTAGEVRAVLAALLSASLNFVIDEPMIATWICYACRMSLTFADESQESRDCRATVNAVLATWGEVPRRTLLSMISSIIYPDRPQPLHRILCHYAQCILSADEAPRRVFETSCLHTLGPHCDVTGWAAAPTLAKLVRLATRLYPNKDKYFHIEMEMATGKG